jgi:hypothetical protein
MIKPVTFEVGGRRYQTIPLTGFEALELDRVVSGLAVQAIGSIGAARSSGGPLGMAMALGSVLRGVAKSDYRELLTTSFSQTVALSDTGKDESLAGDGVAAHFVGRFADMYECLVKVWEANQFTPFVLLERFGKPTAPTPT